MHSIVRSCLSKFVLCFPKNSLASLTGYVNAVAPDLPKIRFRAWSCNFRYMVPHLGWLDCHVRYRYSLCLGEAPDQSYCTGEITIVKRYSKPDDGKWCSSSHCSNGHNDATVFASPSLQRLSCMCDTEHYKVIQLTPLSPAPFPPRATNERCSDHLLDEKQ